jgi:Cu-processing system ATP-binding protein
MIRLEGASKRFGTVTAVAPLDLEIGEGEWLGLFGRNGSGKTSLLRMLVGLSRPSTGRVLLGGKEPTAKDWRDVRRDLGFMPERVAMFEDQTGERTLRYFARLKGTPLTDVGPLLERVGLSTAATRRVGTYSKGMLQRLNLAQALLGDPRLLVLDEPLSGLDVQGVKELFDLLGTVEGRTVVLSSHRLPIMSRFVDRICVLRAGQIAALGTEEELQRRVDLPARVIVHPTPGANGSLCAEIERLGNSTLVSRNGRLVVSVPQTEKVRFLARLDGFGAAIESVRIEEPSLEEVLHETS